MESSSQLRQAALPTPQLATITGAQLQLSAALGSRQALGGFSLVPSSLTEAPAGPLRQPAVCRSGGAGGSGRSSSSSSSSRSSSRAQSGGGGSVNFYFRRAAGFGLGVGGFGAAHLFGGGGVAHACPRWPLSFKGNGGRKKGKQRVLILMSDTGGGHRASAEAIKAGFEEAYGDKYQIDVCDIWTHYTPWPCNQLPKSYSFMVKYSVLWRLNFTTTQPRLVHVPITTAAAALVGRQVSKCYEHYQPDLVVSVHPLMQHVPVRILKQRIKRGLQKPTNFATVVTDLTRCHNTWFYPKVDRCFVATEIQKRQALRLNMREEQLRLYGLPIRPSFSRKYPPKRSLRRSLGMDLDKPAVLLVGGGEGMGPVEKTVDGVAKEIGAECQLVVVCGRNAKLAEKLRSKPYPPGMRVLVLGFVTNMAELMSACDVIITKAGPGTIMEALICGLPMVLNAFVPCQEEGNIPYVVENKVGVFERDPTKAAALIREWLTTKREELAAMAARAKALGQPDALHNIVAGLAELVAPASELAPAAAAAPALA